MLTSNDLTAIGNIVDKKLDAKLYPIVKELKAHGRVLRRVDKDLKQYLILFPHK